MDDLVIRDAIAGVFASAVDELLDVQALKAELRHPPNGGPSSGRT